ncbi:hypothetical protein SDC9_50927 [bioreactor metagenome]|uniref:Uncharacterized protein n=1 Tax=bioreactor metagenome TaxID=1076179 RepID=A0A644WMH4_9ZZZZ
METPTPNTPQKENKSHAKAWRIVGISLLIILIGALVYFNLTASQRHQKAMNDMELKYQQEIARLTMANKTIDSLFKVAAHLEKYRGLVEAGYTRDSSRIVIPHKIGDIVKLKFDSSNVVITDIIVGGGQFEYYVRYRVMHSNRKEEEIAPEMVFD